jgi:hypothetical protein
MNKRKSQWDNDYFDDFHTKYNYLSVNNPYTPNNTNNNKSLTLINPNKQKVITEEVKKPRIKSTTIIIYYTLPVLFAIMSGFILFAYWAFDGYHVYVTTQSETENKINQANSTWNSVNCDLVYDRIDQKLTSLNEEQLKEFKMTYRDHVITSPENKQKCDNAKIILDEGYTYIFWKNFVFEMVYGPCTKLLTMIQTPLTYLLSSVGILSSAVTFFSFFYNYFPLSNLFMLGRLNQNGALNV